VHADTSTLLVSLADKLHNARATLGNLQEASDPATIWSRFSATPDQSIDNYRALIDAYKRGSSDPRRDLLVHELTLTVEAMVTYA